MKEMSSLTNWQKLAPDSQKIHAHKPPLKIVKLIIKNHYKDRTIARFYRNPLLSDDCFIPIKIILEKHPEFGKYIKTLNKEDAAMITKVLTGHNNLNKHSYRIKHPNDSHCEYCEEEERNSNTHPHELYSIL